VSLPESTPGLTPVPDLFTYHIFGEPSELHGWEADVSTYRLSVCGMVDRELSLTVDEIRGGFGAVTAEMVLQCMTNVHWGRLRITGTRLLDVLTSAGLSDRAAKVALRGADGFDSDLLIEDIREKPGAFLLAYEMNGEPLTGDHGFPVRMASEGRYGYKWPKWLTEIEAVDTDYKGHYEGKRRWSDAGRRGQPVT